MSPNFVPFNIRVLAAKEKLGQDTSQQLGRGVLACANSCFKHNLMYPQNKLECVSPGQDHAGMQLRFQLLNVATHDPAR